MRTMVASIVAAAGVALAGAAPAGAADLPLKAPPLAPAVPGWTGFYIGGQIGGGWGTRTVSYAGNDRFMAIIFNAANGLGGQPVFPHRFNLGGLTGGVELGYNWQIAPRWLIGIETDFSGANIKGSGSGTSLLEAPLLTQTVDSSEKIDWWGTVRPRLGFLATNDVLVFATAGFAYGKVTVSDSYTSPLVGGFPTGSVRCSANTVCFTGSNSSVKTGWTAGAGGEWRFAPSWSVKAEYLYVNLGGAAVVSTALAPRSPGDTPSSYTADFGRTDFHVVRAGVNFHF